MNGNPYLINGPALLNISGGLTSAFLARQVLNAHSGELPDDVRCAFANTGKEMPQTLDFVRDIGERWGVDIAWLEYRDADKPAERWHQVTYETASREGEPFDILIKRKNALPNPAMRMCTEYLKIFTLTSFAASLGWSHFTNVLGVRADESSRWAGLREGGGENWDNAAPLRAAGVTRGHIAEFWKHQNFKLELPSHNGITPLGNCDNCYLKSATTIAANMRDVPSSAPWWIRAERRPLKSKPEGARFRNDRPSYAEIWQAVQDQNAFDFGEADKRNDCYCGDGS